MKKKTASGRRGVFGGLLAALCAIVCMVAFMPATADPHTQSEAVQPLTDDCMSNAYQSGIGRSNGHDYVDLGLSVKWATCNVGATSPEEYGDYFAWAEIYFKPTYNMSNSKSSEVYFEDISGDCRYDAARVNWSGKWRLPTLAEIDELFIRCEWTYMIKRKGCKITGPNGNSIFLPAAGYFFDRYTLEDVEAGYYWCSTPYDDDEMKNAYCFRFNKGEKSISIVDRCEGRSIRPVME